MEVKSPQEVYICGCIRCVSEKRTQTFFQGGFKNIRMQKMQGNILF